MIRNKLREKIGEQQSVYEALKSGGDSQVCYQEFQNGEWGTDDANYTNRLRLACYEDAHAHNSMENQISTYKHFIPAGNEPSGRLQTFGDCREGQIPRCSAALQV